MWGEPWCSSEFNSCVLRKSPLTSRRVFIKSHYFTISVVHKPTNSLRQLITIENDKNECQDGPFTRLRAVKARPLKLVNWQKFQHTTHSTHPAHACMCIRLMNSEITALINRIGCETGPTIYNPFPRGLESKTICRCNYKAVLSPLLF